MRSAPRITPAVRAPFALFVLVCVAFAAPSLAQHAHGDDKAAAHPIPKSIQCSA